MEHEHSAVAKSIRLQNWANDIRDCQSSNLTVAQWCEQHRVGIKTYYYRMKRVREAYLKAYPVDAVSPLVDADHEEVRFTELLPPSADNTQKPASAVITSGHIRIEISESISEVFLRKIIEVLSNVV